MYFAFAAAAQDIKPGNCLLHPSGQLCIGDFGLARRMPRLAEATGSVRICYDGAGSRAASAVVPAVAPAAGTGAIQRGEKCAACGSCSAAGAGTADGLGAADAGADAPGADAGADADADAGADADEKELTNQVTSRWYRGGCSRLRLLLSRCPLQSVASLSGQHMG